MQLNGAGGAAGGAKWTEKEITMLQTAVNNFALEINTISEIMKNKTVNQIKGALQKKAFDDAGIVLQQVGKSAIKRWVVSEEFCWSTAITSFALITYFWLQAPPAPRGHK